MDVAHHCAATATTTTAANGPFLLHGCSHSNKYQYQHRETELRVLKLNDDGRKATQKEWTKQRVRLLFFCYSQCYRCCWCCCCLPLFFRYIRMIRNTCVYSSISFWFVHVSHAMQCHLLVFFGWCCLRFLMLLEFFVRLLNLLLFLLVVHVTMHWAMPAIRIFWRMWMYSWCIFFFICVYISKNRCATAENLILQSAPLWSLLTFLSLFAAPVASTTTAYVIPLFIRVFILHHFYLQQWFMSWTIL